MYSKTHALRIPLIYKLSNRTLFFILAGILVSVFVFYVYLVNKTVMNIVAREKTERTIATLSGAIGELELKYIHLRNSVTLDLAHAKGFKDVTSITFIPKNASSELSYNTSR
jgi:ABC-type lipoprotein release transport system permease subunit